jgi:hypothetical protein
MSSSTRSSRSHLLVVAIGLLALSGCASREKFEPPAPIDIPDISVPDVTPLDITLPGTKDLDAADTSHRVMSPAPSRHDDRDSRTDQPPFTGRLFNLYANARSQLKRRAGFLRGRNDPIANHSRYNSPLVIDDRAPAPSLGKLLGEL